MIRFTEWASGVFAVALALLILATAVKADDLQSRVVHELQSHGFDRVSVGASLPIETMTECGGHDGETDGRTIRVCDRVPEGCRDTVIAHEWAHIILGRSYGLTKHESEPLARAVDNIIAGDNANCASKPGD